MMKSSAALQRSFTIAAILAALSAVGVSSTVIVEAETSTGSWTMKAPLPAARSEVAAVALDGKLHAIGGSVAGKAGPYHDEYDPVSNTWRSRAPLPEGRDHLALAVAGGRIFAFGGFVASVHKGAGTDAFEYNPASDTWRVLPPMKVARGSAGAAAVDGKIHVIGGRGLDGVVVAAHEVFDPQTGRWTDAAPLPAARDHMAVVAVDGKIHAIGGRFKGPVDRTGRHDVYDPATDRWSSAARRRAAGSPARSIVVSFWCSAANCRPTTLSRRTRATTPRPDAG
jgi:N-acetylneuraminic acid mutarotase